MNHRERRSLARKIITSKDDYAGWAKVWRVPKDQVWNAFEVLKLGEKVESAVYAAWSHKEFLTWFHASLDQAVSPKIR